MGRIKSVKRVEVINPPMTTVAKGRCTSAPADAEMAMGKKPKISDIKPEVGSGDQPMIQVKKETVG